MRATTSVVKKFRRFNTDDGIRRAAISADHLSELFFEGFNTDDGIRRAAMIRAGMQ